MRNPWRWLATLLRRPARRRESQEELRFHVEMFVAEKLRRGVAEAEARRLARIELGDVEVVTEQLADRRAGAGLESLARDLWLAARSLRRAPFFAIVGILLVALGVAASTTFFTLVDRVLLRPLPEPEQLVRLYEHSAERGIERIGVARGNLAEWRRRADSFQGLAVTYAMGRTLSDDSGSRVVEAGMVSCDFFPVVGLPPLHGNFFSAEDCRRATYSNAAAPSGVDPVAVLGHRLWTRDFGADPNVVGRTVDIDRRAFRVIGVAPPELQTITPGAELFMAWELQQSLPRDQRYTTAIGRLRPGVSAAAAAVELEAIAVRLGEETPESNRGWGAGVVSLHQETTAGARPLLLLLLAAAGLLLVIASGNVAILFLARAMARSRELAMRLALGARPGRVLRHGLVEAFVLAACGGAVGVALSYLAIAAVPRLWPDLPRLAEVSPDPAVLLFALAATVIAALVAGLVPAWRMSRTDPLSAFGRGNRTTETRSVQSTRNALVIGEVALTVVLLTAAGLLIRSVQELRAGDTGFDPRGVVVAPIFLDSAAYDSGTKSRAYYAELFERLRALPGVIAVGGATALPTSSLGPDFVRPLWPAGKGGDDSAVQQASVRMITPGYLEALRIPVADGRAFDAGDTPESQPVIAVSESLAQALWPGESAVGRQLVVDYSSAGTYPYEVVGTVGDVRFRGPRSEPLSEIYFPHAQRSYLILNVAVRTAPGTPPIEPLIRDALLAVDAHKPAHGLYPLTELVGATFVREQRAMQLLVAFAILATLLSALGVYGLLTYRVRQHSAEIGVRMALGAGRGRLMGWVAGEAAGLMIRGGLLGLGLAMLGTRLIASLLFGVAPTDPGTALAVIALLAMIAAIATLAPAWRAANVYPAAILRRH
ncbi:MAG: ABC transporter permease [Thermoanaerobaculia bacterium]